VCSAVGEMRDGWYGGADETVDTALDSTLPLSAQIGEWDGEDDSLLLGGALVVES
jgi:hypothetical protein